MKLLWTLFLSITLSIAILVQAPTIESIKQNFEQFGPRVNNLYAKFYEGNETRVQQDLETGEVDIIDWDLPQQIIERWSQAPYNETIAMETYNVTRMYVLDLNNNETIPMYPHWRSPTNYIEFRHAIAHVVNKTKIMTDILKGYGLGMSTPVFPWLNEWFNQEADFHPYDPEGAAAILDAAGFVQGSTLNPYYNASRPGSAQFIRVYPSGHGKAGQDLDPLIFRARYDDPERLATAYLIQNELLSIGVPVIVSGPVRIQEVEDDIWRYHNFHLYTGGWLLSTIPDYLFSLYHSSYYWFPGRCPNYNHINDSELDYWLEMLAHAPNAEDAKTACFEAQRRLAEIVGVVPLWYPVELKAYREVSSRAPEGWSGIINQKNFGVDCDLSFLNVHRNTSEQGGIINYGLFSYIEKLNPIDPVWKGDTSMVSKIYDCLINQDPYTLCIMPWLAESFEVGTWFNMESGINCTKFTFHLRDDIYWHDGTPFTSADVKFTIDYLLQYESWGIPTPSKPWAYYNVMNVEFAEAPDSYTVIVYMNMQNYWTIYNIGSLLIIPKHIWQNISMEEALGPMPDLNLVGTGPFKFVEYVEGNHLLLEANNNYFIYCPVQVSINIKSRRVDPYCDLNFNVTIKNCFSDRSVNTMVNVYFNGLLLENITLTLDSYAQIELGPFNVNRLETGLHEIKVEHSSDSYLNRTCITRKRLWCTIIEDINLDLKVEGKDVALVAKAYGTYPGHDRWSLLADVNRDNKVEGKDVALIAKKFGWTG